MAEDLDDLLAGHHFLHERLGVGQSDLLAQEVGGGALGDGAGGENHADDADHHDEGQDDAVVDHDAEHDKQRDGGDEDVGKALADELAQGVDIVGVVAHDVAVPVGVKVPDRQVLHMVKHLLAHFFQGALGDNGHHLGIESAGDEADCIHGHQDSHKAENSSGDRRPVAALVALVYQGDDLLQEDRRHGADESVDQDAGQRNRQQHRIEFKQGFQQPAEDALGGAAATAGGGTNLSGGGISPLYRVFTLHHDHLPLFGKCKLLGKYRCSSKVLRGCRWH